MIEQSKFDYCQGLETGASLHADFEQEKLQSSPLFEIKNLAKNETHAKKTSEPESENQDINSGSARFTRTPRIRERKKTPLVEL